MNKIFHILLFLSTMSLLSACNKNGPIFEEPEEIAKPASCPKINIIADAHETTDYIGDNKDIINQIYKAKISYGNGECFGNIKEIKLVFPLIINASRGAAMQPAQAVNIDVVTAIAQRNDNKLLQRRVLPVEIFFEESNLDVRYKEKLTFIIRDYDYNQEVFLGFLPRKSP